MPATLHFGLGKKDTIDELTVIWPDRKQQVLRRIIADQTLKISYEDAVVARIRDHEKSIF